MGHRLSPRSLVTWGLVCATVVSLAGCDRLLGSSEKKRGEATAASQLGPGVANPARPAVLPNEVLATVNKVPISKADVEMRIQELKTLTENVGGKWEKLTPDQLKAVLDELVNTELMSQDAASRGLDRTLETQRRWEYLRRGFFAQEWLRWHQERQKVGESDVQKYYDDNKLGFRQPERRRLRQLVVSSESQANQALAQLHGGAVEFSALAKQISIGATASQGGLLAGWVVRTNDKAFLFASEADAEKAGVSSLDPSLEAAAFAIDQVNGISNYVKGPDNQYYIFQLVERQEERQRPLTEVYDGIKNFLLIQKVQQAVDDISKKAAIERFADRLEGLAQ